MAQQWYTITEDGIYGQRQYVTGDQIPMEWAVEWGLDGAELAEGEFFSTEEQAAVERAAATAVGTALVTPGSDVQAAAIAINYRVPDLLNSWWSWPDCVIDAERNIVYITGCTRGGTVKLAWIDLTSGKVGEQILSKELHRADDHYTRAIWLETVPDFGIDDAYHTAPLVAGTYHDRENVIHVQRYDSWHEFYQPLTEQEVEMTTLDSVSYGSLMLNRPDTNFDSAAIIFRGTLDSDNFGAVLRSTDRGATWADGPHKLHDKQYTLIRRAGSNLHLLAIDHPSNVGTPECRYAKVALSSGGTIWRNAAGGSANTTGVSGGLWDAAPADLATSILDLTKMDRVRLAPTGESQRVLDMNLNGTYIAMCLYPDDSDLSGGGTYTVLARQTGTTSNTWAEEPLVASGDAFGPGGYVGGMCFGADVGGFPSVYLARESDGTWRLERWLRTGTAFGAGSWALDAVLYTAPAGRILARPRVPLSITRPGSNFALVDGVVTFGEYLRYDPATFLDFVGDWLAVTF